MRAGIIPPAVWRQRTRCGENRCEVCHQEFMPVRADAWTENRHAADLLCQNCHRGAEHSPNQIAAEVGSCSSCHQDHRSFNADLSRVADSICTACHADIAAHLDKNAPGKLVLPALVNVSNFVTDHPEFRSPKRDPAQIKFSHSRHMRPGLNVGCRPNAAERFESGRSRSVPSGRAN